MIAVLRHELSIYNHSMTAYIFGAFLLLFTGIGAMIYNLNASVANFEYVLSFISICFVAVVPILTMRVLSEEKRQKTDQLLFSLPISTTDIVLGKFFALAVVFAIPMLFICAYPLFFKSFGEVYLPTSYGSILAFYMVGLALLSMGLFISAMTDSQGMAAGICVAVMLVNYFASTLAEYVSSTALGSFITILVLLALLGYVIYVMTKTQILSGALTLIMMGVTALIYMNDSTKFEGLIPDLMNRLSLFSRLSTFINGIFDVTGLFYFLTIIVFFLFLCVQALEKRRYNG